MLFTAIFVIVIGILLADKYTKVGYYLKTIAFGIVIGMLFHGMGVNLLLNMNHWLASRTPVRKEYRVTEIRFLKPNKLARYRTILPECRILKAVDQDNPDDCLYFHVPIKCTSSYGMYTACYNKKRYLWMESSGWIRVLQPIKEAVSTKDYHPFWYGLFFI